MPDAPPAAGRWPERLPVGSFRVTRPSRHDDRTIRFYRDLIGLPVLEIFQASYDEDGTIFGLPDSCTHLELVPSSTPKGLLPPRLGHSISARCARCVPASTEAAVANEAAGQQANASASD